MRRALRRNRSVYADGVKVIEKSAANNRVGKSVALALALSVAATSAALAADLPAPPPVYYKEPPIVYNWTGFYIGGNIGAAWSGLSGGNFSDTIDSTFTAPTNVQFMGGGQIGVNYEFWGGVVIGAEAMFDWLPNTVNALHDGNCSRWHCRLLWHDQQPMADHRDRPRRLCMGPCAPLWQGRRRLGRNEQSYDCDRWRAAGKFRQRHQHQQFWLYRRVRP